MTETEMMIEQLQNISLELQVIIVSALLIICLIAAWLFIKLLVMPWVKRFLKFL